ncbi:MAG: hypothetical protein PHQ86_09810 [Dehalococcoidales bacterium]|nr:hypothetical protein [Dehalococcoidales bacterium]
MMINKETKIITIVAILGLLPFLTLAFLSLVPLKPAEILSIKVINTDNKLYAGEVLYYIPEILKYTNRPARIIKQLLNERAIYYTAVDSNLPMGKSVRVESIKTSTGDMPGKYFLSYTIVYNYFGFRDIIVTARSNVFEIVTKR